MNDRWLQGAAATLIVAVAFFLPPEPVSGSIDRDPELPHIALLPAGGSLTSTTPNSDQPLTWPQEQHRSAQVMRGAALFLRDWTAPQAASSGLGPTFDAASCGACHVELKLRSQPTNSDMPVGVVARTVTLPDADLFGAQVNTDSIAGAEPEGRLAVEWQTSTVTYPDGNRVELRKPVVRATHVASGTETVVALRSPPLLFGWGLMIAADPVYLDHFDHDTAGSPLPTGRSARNAAGQRQTLGWKNSHATLAAQIATAFREDMGIDSASACTQTPCPAELTAADLNAVVEFVRYLPVPEQRPHRPRMYQRGEMLFGQIQCDSCHIPVLRTAADTKATFSQQTIWPYTDLMLHDMGEGLADPGDGAQRSQWRTAALWGIGLVEERRPEHGFLHDGRARTVEEAILWHGGEADDSRDLFTRLTLQQRQALLEYVRAL
ncbi:MAG: di-heme oxidoredictase family protein [Pseudomonadota bacterium]